MLVTTIYTTIYSGAFRLLILLFGIVEVEVNKQAFIYKKVGINFVKSIK